VVGAVDRSDPGVALDDPLPGGHLRALVVGAIALAHPAGRPAPILGMRGQPIPQLGRVALEALEAPLFLGAAIWLGGQRIRGAMARHHRRRGGFELRRLPLEVGAGAAAVLGRVAGELHAVDGEHLAPDQPLPIADRHDGGEHVRDGVAQRADEVGDGGEVRGGVAAEGEEGDVLAAEARDPTAADDTVRVRTEHDLEQHGGRIRGRARVVVAEARVEGRQVDRVRQQVVRGVLEGAGQQLLGEIDGQEARAGVDGRVAGHRTGLDVEDTQ